MESYLVGEELWAVVGGEDKARPSTENAEALKKWTTTNAKAEFVLKKSISPTLFEHIIKCTSANDIWETLNKLFNKRDVGQLQALENELANTTQGDLSIAQFFLKIKNFMFRDFTFRSRGANLRSKSEKTYYSGAEKGVHSFCNLNSRLGETTLLGRV